MYFIKKNTGGWGGGMSTSKTLFTQIELILISRNDVSINRVLNCKK